MIIIQRKVGDTPHQDATHNRQKQDKKRVYKVIEIDTLDRNCVVVLYISI